MVRQRAGTSAGLLRMRDVGSAGRSADDGVGAIVATCTSLSDITIQVEGHQPASDGVSGKGEAVGHGMARPDSTGFRTFASEVAQNKDITMSAARHTEEGELSRRQFVKDSAIAYWTAAGAAGSGMLALPSPAMGPGGLRARSTAGRRRGPSPRAGPAASRSLPCPCPPRRCAAPRRSGRPPRRR